MEATAAGGTGGSGAFAGSVPAGCAERSYRGRDRLLNGLLRLLLVDACNFKGRAIERQVGQFLMGQQVFDLLPGREFGVHGVVEVSDELVHVDGGRGHAQRQGVGGNGRDAMVGGERDPCIRQAAGNVLVQPGEEAVELLIEGVHHLPRLGRVWSIMVPDQVVRGKAEDEHVGDRMLPSCSPVMSARAKSSS